MPEERKPKKIYWSNVSGGNGRDRPPVTLEGEVEQYPSERGVGGVSGLEAAKRSCIDKEMWRPFCHGHPPGWELPGGARHHR